MSIDILEPMGEACAPVGNQRSERVMRSLDRLIGAQSRFDAEPCKRTAWELKSAWETCCKMVNDVNLDPSIAAATRPAREKAIASFDDFYPI